MNYDESLERDRELSETGDAPTKVWIVFIDGKSMSYYSDEESEARNEYIKAISRFGDKAKSIEVGYVWDRDFYRGNFAKTYRYFEPLEKYKNGR